MGTCVKMQKKKFSVKTGPKRQVHYTSPFLAFSERRRNCIFLTWFCVITVQKIQCGRVLNKKSIGEGKNSFETERHREKPHGWLPM